MVLGSGVVELAYAGAEKCLGMRVMRLVKGTCLTVRVTAFRFYELRIWLVKKPIILSSCNILILL
jgi:hypothetical protein